MALTINPIPIDDKNTEIEETLSQLSIGDIQTQFDNRIVEINSAYEESVGRISEAYDMAVEGYEGGLIDVDEVTAEFRATSEREIGNIANAYNTQAQREAERVDALVAGGALGGNAYRAYQAHSQVTRDLMGQASGQIAQVSMSASEKLMNTYAAVGQANQSFTTESLKTIASIAGTQADAMLSFSQLLSTTEVESNKLMQNLMSLQLSTLSQQNEFAIQSAQLDLERQVANQKASMFALQNMVKPRGYRTMNKFTGDVEFKTTFK